MYFPVRCYTCGKVIGRLIDTYQAKIQQGLSPQEVLAELRIIRYCCRRMFLSHTETETID